LAKSVFSGLRSFRESQVSEIGYIFSAKVLASLVQAFLSGLFFSGKVNFSQSQFFGIGFGKFLALAFL